MKNLCVIYKIKKVVLILNFVLQRLDQYCKNVHRVNEFNQNVWLKDYIDVDTNWKNTKKTYEKDFYSLTNNLINLGKTRENVRKKIDIKLVANGREKESFGVRTKLSYNTIISRKHTNSSEKVRKKVKFATKIKPWKQVRTMLYVINNSRMYRPNIFTSIKCFKT